jgi:hypothetical protein
MQSFYAIWLIDNGRLSLSLVSIHIPQVPGGSQRPPKLEPSPSVLWERPVRRPEGGALEEQGDRA